MKWQNYLSPDEVRKSIEVLQEPGRVFEARILSGKNETISGYFKDADTLLKALDGIDPRNRIVYVTIGAVKDECYSRAQCERFIKSPKETTSDNDIVGYRWLLVDIDPVRTSGISSSNEELKASKELAKNIYAYLRNLGFEEPVKALSGNGCHLLYRISLSNSEENKLLVQRCLQVLSALFSDDRVSVDTTVYNPSRICKLHGTLAQKGTSTQDRPHRMSRIFSVPSEIRITSKAFLRKLSGQLPELPSQEKYRSSPQQYGSSDFDLEGFLAEHGMRYSKAANERAEIYRLDECPFDSNHKNGDAKIFLYHNGAIAFKCHHNSCQGYRWQDVRAKFEPDAYEHADEYAKIDLGWQIHNREKSKEQVPYEEIKSPDMMFRTAREIYDDQEPEYEYIRSGITDIDKYLRGWQKGATTVISGLRGSGKSTLLGQIMIQAVSDRQSVVCYSGELRNKKYLGWLVKQAAGKHYMVRQGNDYLVKNDVVGKIIDWMGDNFRLYNNKCGNKFNEIEKFLRVKAKEYRADLIVVDNLMALDLTAYDKDRYEAQTKFMWALKNLSEITNTHVLFVAHPKKVSGFLRLDDISGTGNIGNVVDNALIVHRNNMDFKRGFEEMFKCKPDDKGLGGATNVIEIAKDREYGTQDTFIPLYFEEGTKRLLNARDEFIRYSWEADDDGFIEVLPGDIPF